jgi:RHS repeat-associated protein
LYDSNEVATYTYNGAGQRIKKVAGGATRIFHYDLWGHLIAETNQSGQMLAEYIYLRDQLLAMIKPGEAVYYFHNDHLGTPQVLTDESQTVVWKATYAPFGQANITVGTVENNFRFPGQYYDQETGLHYNYFRYYDPTTGRYVTPDPIGLEGGINLFTYVANNPVNWIDPFGRDVKIKIVRDIFTINSITGTITVTSDRIPDTFTGYTLENARAGLKGNKDPIPIGTYSAYRRYDHEPDRIELEHVPGFTYIQIHKGNRPKELKGCFAVGTDRLSDWVSFSDTALKKILKIIEKDITGRITVEITIRYMEE